MAPFHRFSALAGSIALAILMLPVVTRTTETAVALVPHRLREAGLALGLARWRVAIQLMLPAAAPGVITGAMLAVARAAGETAPLLFTSLGNNFFNLNPTGATQRGVMRVDMQLVSAGGVCDPLLALIPNNSKLVATGNLIRRNDGFAHYLADFAILNPAGATLFKGTMETIDRIGTHHLFFNCEQCNAPSHFEG